MPLRSYSKFLEYERSEAFFPIQAQQFSNSVRHCTQNLPMLKISPEPEILPERRKPLPKCPYFYFARKRYKQPIFCHFAHFGGGQNTQKSLKMAHFSHSKWPNFGYFKLFSKKKKMGNFDWALIPSGSIQTNLVNFIVEIFQDGSKNEVFRQNTHFLPLTPKIGTKEF